MSRAWGRGSTRRWRKLRALILDTNREANAGRCVLALDGQGGATLYPDQPGHTRPCPRHGQLCKAPCARVATVAHHTRGRAVTGDDPRFIVAACGPCNLHVGEPTAKTSTVAADPRGRAVTRW